MTSTTDPAPLSAILATARAIVDGTPLSIAEVSAHATALAHHILATEQRGEPVACEGLTARWCPRCGTCTCPQDGDLNADGCPLHDPRSTHAEAPPSDSAEVTALKAENAALLDDRAHAWRDDCRDTMLLGRLAELTAQRDFAHEKSTTRDRLLSEQAGEVTALKAEVAALERTQAMHEATDALGVTLAGIAADLKAKDGEVAALKAALGEACEELLKSADLLGGEDIDPDESYAIGFRSTAFRLRTLTAPRTP